MIDGKRLTYLTMLAKMGEQMQGGLFDEESTRLSTTDIHGQSQTPEARYARAYRSNPENKKRINENRRKNRQMKKEKANKVGLVLESAARPLKEEQQTVETPVSYSDNQSLPNSGLEENRVYTDPVQTEILRQISEIKGVLLKQQPINSSTRNLEDPAAQSNATIKERQDTNNRLPKKKTLLKSLAEMLPVLGASLLILAFLGFNTYFLVSEQQSLYTSMSYSASMALMIALLSEGSLILLSTMASWTSNLEWKIGLTTGMVVMVAVMVGVLDSSAQNRSNTAARQTQEAKNIEKQIATLRALEAPILARIEKLDPQHYRTEISRLSSQLTTPPNGYSYKIEQLSNKLANISTSNADTTKLLWQRRAALFINLLLSAFLGFLWSKNQESVLTKIGKSLSVYWQKTCEV